MLDRFLSILADKPIIIINPASLPIKTKTMRKVYFTCFFLLTVIVITSCVSSLYPITDNKNDFLFREELLGHWAGKDMQTQVIIKKAENKKYGVTVIDKKNNKNDGKNSSIYDTSYFSGFLIQLNSQFFFDCTPDTDHPQFDCMAGEIKSALLPLHSIYKIYSIGKYQLSMAGMNIDSLQKFIDKDKNKVKHEKLSKDHILITADARGLQKKILANKEAAFVFSELTILNRKK